MTNASTACASDWEGRPLIAVVGMGCVLPGASDVEGFRRRLHEGRLEFSEIPPERWDWRRYASGAPGRWKGLKQSRAALLGELPFEPAELGLPPRASKELHRMERALLLAAREAARDAGLRELAVERERIEVVLGFMDAGTPSQRNLVFKLRLPEMLEALRGSASFQRLPPGLQARLLQEAEASYREALRDAEGEEDGVVSAYSSVVAARIAMMLDVRGAHLTVDAACASSLAAMDLAIQSLQAGRCDAVITGGASSQVTPLTMVSLSSLGLISTGEVRPFDASASGTLLGEGAGLLVLRRLSDALRDGQRVRAVLRGLGASSGVDGRALFASSPAGQERALRMAYARAGYGPEAVQYVEAHANGVPEGDRVELEALNAVFAPRVPERARIALGSVKERIGYLQAGAGALGLIRTLVALEDRRLPAQVTFRQAMPGLLEQGPFHVNTEERPWRAAAEGLPLRASVSALGFGGANYHLTLESFEPGYHQELDAARAPLRRAPPVSVVGLGAVLPQSPDPEALWSNLLAGRELGSGQEGAWYTRAPRDWEQRPGVFIGRAARLTDFHFQAREHHIAPTVANGMERSFQWLLEATRQAITRAGLGGAIPERTAVILAANPHGELHSALELSVASAEFEAALGTALEKLGLPPEEAAVLREETGKVFRERLPELTEDTLLGCMRNVAAARVGRALGVKGPCFALDAGCASSCAALERAVEGLASGELDLAVVGGVSAGITAEFLLDTAAFGGKSASACRPFDSEADGFIPGDGAIVLVLQRAEDARRDGRPGLLRILGIGSSGNGRQGSLFSISVPGMVRAIRQAVESAGVEPGTIGLIEAHGSCSPVGDTLEMAALTRVYGGQPRERALLVGCCKSMTGNLMAAAGMLGLTALALSVQHGFAPPIAHLRTPDPELPLTRDNIHLPQVAQPWYAAPGHPRRAALSSFTIGGLNYHMVVEQDGVVEAERP